MMTGRYMTPLRRRALQPQPSAQLGAFPTLDQFLQQTEQAVDAGKRIFGKVATAKSDAQFQGMLPWLLLGLGGIVLYNVTRTPRRR